MACITLIMFKKSLTIFFLLIFVDVYGQLPKGVKLQKRKLVDFEEEQRKSEKALRAKLAEEAKHISDMRNSAKGRELLSRLEELNLKSEQRELELSQKFNKEKQEYEKVLSKRLANDAEYQEILKRRQAKRAFLDHDKRLSELLNKHRNEKTEKLSKMELLQLVLRSEDGDLLRKILQERHNIQKQIWFLSLDLSKRENEFSNSNPELKQLTQNLNEHKIQLEKQIAQDKELQKINKDISVLEKQIKAFPNKQPSDNR